MSLEFSERDRESVDRDLRDADEEVRRLAVERLEVFPADQGIARLVDCLADPSWRVRKAAVGRVVARPESDQVTRALIAALADGDNPGRRNAAVEALVQCGVRSVASLLEATHSPDEDVRKLVVDALAGIGHAGSRERLLEMLADPDANVRASSADALGVVGGPDVPRALLAVVTTGGEDQLVRFSAIRALVALDAPVRADELGSILDDSVLGPAALALMGSAGDDDRAVEVLLKALGSASRSSREAAMRSLVGIVARAEPEFESEIVGGIRGTAQSHPKIVENALDHLEVADLPTRLVLIQFLGLVGAEAAAVPVLVAGRDEALWQVALETLVALGEPAEAIIDANWSELDAASRRDGCVLFGRTRGARGASRLLAALDDPSAETRTAAARSIGQRRLEAGLAPLIQRLIETARDDDFESEEELAAVVEALTSLARPAAGDDPISQQAIEGLSSSLEGASEEVRLAIATVIGQIGRPQDCETVAFLLRDPSARVRRAAVEALAQLEPGAETEALRLALADESALVRIAAARALGASRRDSVVDDLAQLALDEDSQVRAAAVSSIVRRFVCSDDAHCRGVALGVIDSALEDEAPVALSAIEALSAAGGPESARAEGVLARPEIELVREAIRCIAAHADPSGLEPLLALIAHRDWSVRAEAIQALAERRVVRAVPSILRRLETEQDDFVREITLAALKRLEGGVA